MINWEEKAIALDKEAHEADDVAFMVNNLSPDETILRDKLEEAYSLVKQAEKELLALQDARQLVARKLNSAIMDQTNQLMARISAYEIAYAASTKRLIIGLPEITLDSIQYLLMRDE